MRNAFACKHLLFFFLFCKLAGSVGLSGLSALMGEFTLMLQIIISCIRGAKSPGSEFLF